MALEIAKRDRPNDSEDIKKIPVKPLHHPNPN
jgi:hypothetical protein